MRKRRSAFVFSFVLTVIFCFAGCGYGFADQEAPDGELAAPPPLAVKGPPDVVVVPSEQFPNQYVYMVPGMEGVYVYQGVWYRQNAGFWFSSPAYNGIWTPIGVAVMPPVIMSVPVEYALYIPAGYHRIHYGEYYGHWRSWESGRYWHHQAFYQHEMRAETRRARMEHIEHHRAEARANEHHRTEAKAGEHHTEAGAVKKTESKNAVTAKGDKNVEKSQQNAKDSQSKKPAVAVKQNQNIANKTSNSGQGQKMASQVKNSKQQQTQGQKGAPGQQAQKQQAPKQQVQRQQAPKQQAPKQAQRPASNDKKKT
jgi:hypothetical protein